jgi:hypothetical protein
MGSAGQRREDLARCADAMDGLMGESMGGGLHPSIALRDGFDVVFEIVPE